MYYIANEILTQENEMVYNKNPQFRKAMNKLLQHFILCTSEVLRFGNLNRNKSVFKLLQLSRWQSAMK